MKLEICHTDTCLPDYFSGDARPWLCVPVTNRTSCTSLRADLHSELNQGAIGGNDPITRDDSGPEGDKWFKAAHAAINRCVVPRVKGNRRPFADLEDCTDDDCESVYAYFVFIEL